MSKQEEIGEGMNKLLVEFAKDYQRASIKQASVTHYKFKLLEYLHSQGVVRKVEQQLADIGIEYYNENVAKMLKAGYVAVEPLIEEG